ncbi:uncharacterized protein LOC144544436 [Carex rostrata]
MSSKRDPAKSSVGSRRSTDHHYRRPYANSPWIKRLRRSPSPPPPPPARSLSARAPTVHRHYTISTDESCTSLKLPQRDQDEPGEVISGFDPFQFDATNQILSWQFPLVARIARFSCEEWMENRRREFKLSPFFQIRPSPGARFTMQNFSQRRFSVIEGKDDFHIDATETAPNTSVQRSPPLYVTNQEGEPFSYWNFGRITRNGTISSFSNVSSRENLTRRKRPQMWG